MKGINNLSYLKELGTRLSSLVIFRNLLNDIVIKNLREVLFCEKGTENITEGIERYAQLAASLFNDTENLTEYVWTLVSEDENFYVLKRARGIAPSQMIESCLENELKILEEISQIRALDIQNEFNLGLSLPEWISSPADFLKRYMEKMESIKLTGWGMFARNIMFTLTGGSITPVKTPDHIRLSDLNGYERERGEAISNTLALIEGKPAANVLLYGDAGTGKSSTVKAMVNEFGSRGLRLIEVRKNELNEIPGLVESLGDNPLKFIIFIDDLSFSGENEQIGALKAVLEGSVSSKTANVAIYATSNRRHIVNEKFSDRMGDDIHQSETIEEQVSLSARFGLAIYYAKPGKDKYLEIVRKLASQYGIQAETGTLDIKAEAFALSRGGRSPRTARQFVDCLRCGSL